MIERTTSEEYIRAIATHPRVWPWISEEEDDPSKFVPDFARTIYLRVDGGYLGFRPFTRSCWEIHISLLPKTAQAAEKALAAIGWMRAYGVPQLLAKIPAPNRHAIRLAKAVGFRECGRVSACVHRGAMHDMVLMELT